MLNIKQAVSMEDKMENRENFKKRLRYKMSPDNLLLVMSAYRLSKHGHRGQMRDRGERYFEHPRRVALILIDELRIYDYEMLITALLHDIEEDSFILTPKDIERNFGERVRDFVELLTKKKDQPLAEYLANLQKADEAAQIIKLADRLDNIRDIMGCTQEKIEKISAETITYFIPWAEKICEKLAFKIAKAWASAKHYLDAYYR